jgi:GT2 family glycosyltransferase
MSMEGSAATGADLILPDQEPPEQVDHGGMERPRASIVIVAYGKRSVTEACLESLDAALGSQLGTSFELVLVDNASPDDTLDLFEAWRPRATIVALDHNRDFSGGCNAGAAASAGEVLIFLNNDTLVPPGALEPLVEQVREEGVSAAGPRLLYPDGSIQHAGVWMVLESSGKVVPYHLFHHAPGDLPAARITTDIDCVTGACLVVRRDRFEEIDGFDVNYRNGWEDVDLCLRLRVAGGTIVYRGDVCIVHAEGATRGRDVNRRLNATLFYRRWESILEDDLPAFKRIWDGNYGTVPAASHDSGTALIVGPIRALGPVAAHTRAVISALEATGGRPVAVEDVANVVCPHLTGDEWAPIMRALARTVDGDLEPLDVSRFSTPVVPGPTGPGGAGTLVILPAHDLDTAARALAVAGDRQAPITVVPTALCRGLAAFVAAHAPGAALLDPCTSEEILADYAAQADVVVALDPSDPWDRAALVCAGTGAAVIVRPGGPADGILGELAAAPGRRDERTDLVRRACAPERVLLAQTAVAAG